MTDFKQDRVILELAIEDSVEKRAQMDATLAQAVADMRALSGAMLTMTKYAERVSKRALLLSEELAEAKA